MIERLLYLNLWIVTTKGLLYLNLWDGNQGASLLRNLGFCLQKIKIWNWTFNDKCFVVPLHWDVWSSFLFSWFDLFEFPLERKPWSIFVVLWKKFFFFEIWNLEFRIWKLKFGIQNLKLSFWKNDALCFLIILENLFFLKLMSSIFENIFLTVSLNIFEKFFLFIS